MTITLKLEKLQVLHSNMKIQKSLETVKSNVDVVNLLNKLKVAWMDNSSDKLFNKTLLC